MSFRTLRDRDVDAGGEGEVGALDAVDDAAVYPAVFLIPQNANGTYRVVEFFDVLEGASYENTFGWYNVEDTATLYGALTCSDGDGIDADVEYEPGDDVVIDFQAEFEAGHHLGGFIGFFLVSANGGGGNCGEPGDCGASAASSV